jgi:branched-chain amino acid transport system permease protein
MWAQLPQVLVNGVVLGAVYALIGVGFAIIYSTLGVLHFAHGVVFVAASYIVFWFSLTMGVPVWLGIVAGIVIAVGLSLLINALIYEPLRAREARPYIVLVASIGTFIVLENLIGIQFAFIPRLFELPFSKVLLRPILVGNIYLTPIAIIIVATAIVLCVGMYLFFSYTKVGTAVLAVGHDTELAEIVGMRTKLVRYVAMGLGSALAAVTAILWSIQLGQVDMTIGWVALFVAFFATIFAGEGKIAGAGGTGFIMGIVWNLAALRFPTKWSQTILFMFIITVLWIKPEGVFGTRTGRMGK